MADLTLKARPTVVATESIARMNYDDQWIVTRHVCEHCNWQGCGHEMNNGTALYVDAEQFCCPGCGASLAVLSSWTIERSCRSFGNSLVLKAAFFAANRHSALRRKDAEASPYINHPLALADLLANEFGVVDSATLCAALLHDTIEDTKTTGEELEKHFGTEIRRLVEEVTDNKTLDKAERKRLQVDHAHLASYKARLVKLADKICNLRDLVNAPPVDWTLERKREYFDWAKSVIDRIRGTHENLELTFDRAFEMRP